MSMINPGFRALCAEMLDCDDGAIFGTDLVTRARAALAQPESEGVVKYNEDFWRKDALEKLVYAATAFRLGIYSAEELEIAENRARFFLARWGRPTIEPVPVSERLPGPEDCDAKGRCWLHQPHPATPETPEWRLMPARYASTIYNTTHWLPHWALPVPQQEVK